MAANPPYSLGYIPDHPGAVASRTNPKNWNALLLPLQAAPTNFDWDMGPVLDQDGVGACVAFGATHIRAQQEHVDEQKWAFNTDSAFVTYDWLKHGHGTFPGDGAPDVEGSWPGAMWDLALKEGVPGADGVPRKIEAYYQLSPGPAETDAQFIQRMFDTTYTYGPVSIATGWPSSWFSPNAQGIVPAPSSDIAGGHMYAVRGRVTDSSGTKVYAKCRNSWSIYWGLNGDFLIPVEYLNHPSVGLYEMWKTLDILGDNPTPGGPDVLPAIDKVPRLLSIPVGTQFYTPDTNQPLVKLGGTKPARVYSPHRISTTQYACVISTGGVQQTVRVNMADVTVIATSSLT